MGLWPARISEKDRLPKVLDDLILNENDRQMLAQLRNYPCLVSSRDWVHVIDKIKRIYDRVFTKDVHESDSKKKIQVLEATIEIFSKIRKQAIDNWTLRVYSYEDGEFRDWRSVQKLLAFGDYLILPWNRSWEHKDWSSITTEKIRRKICESVNTLIQVVIHEKINLEREAVSDKKIDKHWGWFSF